MAEKKTSGFKTFLLIFITIILFFVLGIAAFLVLVPNTSIFGIKYISLKDNEIVDKVNAHDLKFNQYKDIYIDTSYNNSGRTNVSILTTKEVATSQIVLKENHKGFIHTDARDKFELTVQESGTSLYISLIEPEMNFISLSLRTTLFLYVHTTENLEDINYHVVTNTGSVILGDKHKDVGVPLALTAQNLEVKTESGSLNIKRDATIVSSLKFTSNSGGVNFEADSNVGEIEFITETGKIKTKNFTNPSCDVNIKTNYSKMTIGNVAGNVHVDSVRGVIEIGDIVGNLVGESNIDSASVKTGKIGGNVSFIKETANFILNLEEVNGYCNISAGNKSITIGKLKGQALITTNGGEINVGKDASNTNKMTLQSNSGNIIINFDVAVHGENLIQTTNGNVTVNYKGGTSNFYLSLTTNGNSTLDWLDNHEKKITAMIVGENPPLYDNIIINQNSGSILVHRK